MPIYEYRCSACGHHQEILRKMSDPPLSQCPSCGKGTLTKLVSAAGFQLKGSGWYATDFKGGGSKPAADAGKDGAAVKDDAKPAGDEKAAPAKVKEEPKADAAKGAGAGPVSP